jgi:hypothetical protein
VKNFEFKLQQALRWRELQLDLQKARLAAATAARFRAEAEIAARREEAHREHILVRHMETGAAFDAYAGFRARTQQSIEILEKQAVAARKAEAGEMIRLREADRKAQLLERMRDTQLVQWRKDYEKETEAFAAEAFLWRPRSGHKKNH